MGVQLQIDDFGTGYSSLGYLSHFQVNALKIDQSFVDGIVDDSSQRDIVKAIITLTERLNVRVIAEGVETKEQLQQLRELGCEWGQGYLMAMPLHSEQVIDLLKKLKASQGTLFALNNISI
jgi:EAL domain-containing protein (putative c-di-GMP-specific phosphodiesterase class I)